jgi:uncharacterized protein
VEQDIKANQILHIEGMTCAGCETRIENVLRKLDGIEKVEAKFSTSTVEVSYMKNIINQKQIIDKIESLDYKVNIGKKYTKVDDTNKSKSNILQFLGILVVLVAVYILIQNTIGFNVIPEVNQSMGYGMLFVIGLLTSLHCIAMCGGINISQCATYKEQNYKSKFTPSLLYNMGRVISYTLIGGIFGAFGSLINISGFTKGIAAIISSILMLIIGINMLNIFPWLKKFNPKIPKFLINKFKGGKSKKGPLFIGLLNGLMPCGPLQAMQIYALGTGSFIAGSMSMLVFSLGTIPLMFGLGTLSSFLTSKFSSKMIKVSAVLVIFLSILMINRGFSLSGVSIIPNNISILNSTNNASSGNVAVVKDGVQTITTNLTNGRYTPIVVQKGIPVKWIIKVKAGELNGCNNPLTIPKYNKTYKLVVGDNLIEFTPTEEGNIIYTCWMGMISSNITVVNNISDIKQSDINQNNSINTAPPSTGGCCGR